MAQEDADLNQGNVLSEQPRIAINPREEIGTQIEFQLTRQLMRIGIWVVSSVLILVLGTIVGALYTMNGKVNELTGKYSTPEKFMETLSSKVQQLEDENKSLNNKIHNLELEKLQQEINKLKDNKK